MSRIINVLLVLFSTLLTSLCISSLIFDYSVCVQSGSMEPTLFKGSLAFCRLIDINEGDIIYFTHEDIPYLHRVVDITEYGIRTQGDANPTPDPFFTQDAEVQGKVVLSIPFLGYFATVIDRPIGKLFCAMFLCSLYGIHVLLRKKGEG